MLPATIPNVERPVFRQRRVLIVEDDQRLQDSVAALLREAGYMTAFAGKFGFQVTGNGRDRIYSRTLDGTDEVLLLFIR